MMVGYTSGVFDLFHIGHVNILRNAKSLCDRSIVAVSTDELVLYKNKRPVIPFEERIEIARSSRYVDLVVPQENMNKFEAHDRYKFNILMVGDDWYQDPKWKVLEAAFIQRDVRAIYFPYTKSTSSTLINDTLVTLRNASGTVSLPEGRSVNRLDTVAKRHERRGCEVRPIC